MGAFERAVRALSAGGMHVGAAACLTCFAFMCYSVAMRYFAGAPQPWVDQVVGWLVVAIVMFAAPEAQFRGEHVAVDTLFERVHGGKRRTLAAFALVWIAATAVVMIWEGWGMVAFSRMTGMMTDLHPIPLWWIQVLVPVGFALMLLVALVQLLRVARALDGGDASAIEEAERIKASPLE